MHPSTPARTLEFSGTKSFDGKMKESSHRIQQLISKKTSHTFSENTKDYKPHLVFDHPASILLMSCRSFQVLHLVLGYLKTNRNKHRTLTRRQRNQLLGSSLQEIRKTVNKWKKISARTYNRANCFLTLPNNKTTLLRPIGKKQNKLKYLQDRMTRNRTHSSSNNKAWWRTEFRLATTFQLGL